MSVVMPDQTQQAVMWALTQRDPSGEPVTKDNRHWLVHYVRMYFNNEGIDYESFSYQDLVPYLPAEHS